MPSSRSTPRAIAALTLVTVVILSAAPSAPAASPAVTGRVTVAVIGDSISESSQVAAPDRNGLAAALRRDITRRRIDAGGEGFVMAHPTEFTDLLPPQPGMGDWRYSGTWDWLTAYPGVPTSVASWTRDTTATATLATDGANRATLVYLAGPHSGRVRFAAGGDHAVIHAHKATPTVKTKTLTVAAGTSAIAVRHVAGGGFGLVGAFLRRRLRPGHAQLEVTAFARAGEKAADPIAALTTNAFALLRPQLTVIEFGTNDAIYYQGTHDAGRLTALRQGLVRRGRLARRSGRCIMIPPQRGEFPAWVATAADAQVAAAARTTGCHVDPVLDQLHHDRSLTVDGIHPTAAGYAKVAAALTPEILHLTHVAAPKRR